MEYRLLLSSLAHQISADELVTMKFLCADFISYPESLETQPNSSCLMEVLGFFMKLETKNKLGIDDLDLMKKMLSHLKKDDLLLKVTEFQVQRQAYLSSLGIAERESETNQTTRSQQEESPEEKEQRQPSEPQDRGDQQGAVGSQTSRGALVMQCAPYLVGGAWAVGSVYILNRYKEDPKALVNIVSEVVVPTGTLIKSIFPGSINFLLQATDLNSLKELWKRYQSGQLKKDLQKVLVTEELKNLANGEPIDLVVTISEQEYRNACLDLMVAQTKEIFGVLPFISFQSSQIQFRASVGAVVTKLKEIAELLVKIFKLNPELLKVSKAMDDPPQRTTGTKIALLVAPSYNGLPARALPGTVHDLEAMRDITEKLQFDNVNEVGGEDATKDNILRSLDDLSSKAISGSIVLFYYCGHGYYLPSTKDEGLVPADATEQKLKDVAEDTCITGKDLQPFLEQFAKNKVKLTLIFDCCYSGQLYRVIELQNSGCTDVIPRQVIFQETLARSPPASDSEETGNKLLRGGWTPGEKDTFFYIAACSPVQVAYESIGRGGRLTTAIKTVFDSLHDLSFPKPVSIMAFFRLIEREFKMKGWYQQQTPQLEGANLYIELFGARTCEAPSKSQGITVEEVDGDEVILNAGCLQNLSPGLYDVFETTVSDIGVNHGKDCSDWLGSIDVTEGGIEQIQTSGLIVERNPDKDKKIEPKCLAFLKTASNIKTNAWIKTTPEDSVPEENIQVLLDHIKQTNILNVSTKQLKIEDKDLITIGVELHGSSNQKQCWVARQGGDIIVPPLSLGSEEIMANNLNRYLRYQSALASAQPPKQDHELLKNVGVKVLRIEKVKPVKDKKQQRIREGLQCGKDLYEDPYQCPVLLSHSLSGDPQMNKIQDNTGDAFLFQVTNHSKEEKDTIHICVLFYQFDGAIKAIYPKGGMGCTKELRGDDTAEDILRVVIPFNSLRKMAEPDPSKPEPDRGVDTIVVYATSKPANFGPLLQTVIETDPDLIARGKEESPEVLSDLAKFLLPIKQRCLEDHPDDMDFKWFVEKKEFAVVKNTNS